MKKIHSTNLINIRQIHIDPKNHVTAQVSTDNTHPHNPPTTPGPKWTDSVHRNAVIPAEIYGRLRSQSGPNHFSNWNIGAVRWKRADEPWPWCIVNILYCQRGLISNSRAYRSRHFSRRLNSLFRRLSRLSIRKDARFNRG